jgi:hypothetical protein
MQLLISKHPVRDGIQNMSLPGIRYPTVFDRPAREGVDVVGAEPLVLVLVLVGPEELVTDGPGAAIKISS